MHIKILKNTKTLYVRLGKNPKEISKNVCILPVQ